MPFVALLPLLIIGAVVVASMRADQMKKQQSARRNSSEQFGKPAEPASRTPIEQRRPIQPSVQIPAQKQTPRAAAGSPFQSDPEGRKSSVNTTAQKQQTAVPRVLPKQDAAQTTIAVPEPQADVSPLSLDPQSVLQGVLFTEILGKPKALR